MSWKEVPPPKTAKQTYYIRPQPRPQPIQMEECIWWSTDYLKFYEEEQRSGMVQYDIQSGKIISVVKYPKNIEPEYHSCCQYKNEIYIVDGENGQIIAFNTQNKQFQIKTKKK
eukprot:704383_1